MISVTIGPKSLAALRRAPKELQRGLRAGVTESSLYLQREAAERAPTSGAGLLRNSIGALPVREVAGMVTAGVGTSLSYAAPVELGTRPHFPPIAPLEDWVSRVLGKSGREGAGIARAIQRKIGKHGTKPRHFMKETLEKGEGQVQRIVTRQIDRAVARVGGTS
jgi:hypothetical protein